jgi:hypothetical protein
MDTAALVAEVGHKHTKQRSLTSSLAFAAMDLVDIDFERISSDLDHHGICYVLHVCGTSGVPSQTHLIEYESIE